MNVHYTVKSYVRIVVCPEIKIAAAAEFWFLMQKQPGYESHGKLTGERLSLKTPKIAVCSIFIYLFYLFIHLL